MPLDRYDAQGRGHRRLAGACGGNVGVWLLTKRATVLKIQDDLLGRGALCKGAEGVHDT